MYSSEVVLSHPQQNPDTITLNVTVNIESLCWLELHKYIYKGITHNYDHHEILDFSSSPRYSRDYFYLYVYNRKIINGPN